jgi:4-amino-4-deoxy-L-arabinose transferase-like glycosyltransferase
VSTILRQHTPAGLSEGSAAAARSLLTAAPAIQLLLVWLVGACLFFAGLGWLPLLEPDEGRNAGVAREMLDDGDWITPHFDTLPYLDKPAIFFWMVAGSMRIFGVSEWAARFPSALTALATASLVWLLAKRMFRDKELNCGPYGHCAALAAIVWATSPLVITFARQVILDMTLTFLLTLAMVCFWLAASQSPEGEGFRRLGFNLGFFGSMGLGTFVKGPVGFVLPLLSVCLYQALRGRLRQLARLRWGVGLTVFLVVSVPWFVLVSIRNPAFPRYALWEETLVRFTTDHLHRSGGVFYYLPVLLGGLFPWSFCLLFGGWNRLRRWKELKQEKHQAELFLLIWAAVILAFFSIARSKLPGYILPATVPLGILMARLWADVERNASRRRPDWLTAAFAMNIVLGILVIASPQLLRVARWQAFARSKIPPNVLPFIRPELFFTGLILAAVGVLGRSFVQRLGTARARPKGLSLASFAVLAVTVPLLLVRWALPLRGYAEAYSSRQLAREIQASDQRDMAIYGYFYFRTGLPFYLRRPVGLVTSGGTETTSNYVVSQFQALRRSMTIGSAGPSQSLSSTPSGDQARTKPPSEGGSVPQQQPTRLAPVLIEAVELKELSHSSAPFLVIARNVQVPDVYAIAGSVQPRWSAWDYSVVEITRSGSEAQGEPALMIDGVVRRKRRR